MSGEDYTATMFHLDESTCRRVLQRSRFGRVGFVDGDRGNAVLPVNALYADGAIFFRTAAGSSLHRAANGQVLAYEVDHIDPVAESGWSVLVRGSATLVDRPDEVTFLADADVHPWAPGVRDRWVRIDASHVTGRIIERHRMLQAGIRLPYIPSD